MFRQKKENPNLFFKAGWGDESQLRALREYELSSHRRPLAVELSPARKLNRHFVFDGSFATPFETGLLPKESQIAHFQLHSPSDEFRRHPVSVIFAMTGDEGFDFRYKSYSAQLLKRGVASLLIENPFYGVRKPSYQKTFHCVSVADMLALALCSVVEGVALMHWLKDQGVTKIGVAGISQAAMIAGGVGAFTPFPIAVAASLVAHSPEVILCDGLLKNFVDWKAIEMHSPAETQYRLIETFRSTDLTRLPRPHFPAATLLQGAFNDLVAPRYSVRMIHRLWPGSELRWLPGTHVTSIALHKGSFSRLIADAFEKLGPAATV